MSFTIQITDIAYDELRTIKSFYRRQIVDAIDEQLTNEPTTETKKRKILMGI